MLTKKEKTECPRCSRKFICNPSDIRSCNCSKVELTTEEYRFISSKYSICVCNACLMDLKGEYNRKISYNEPDNFISRMYSLGFFLTFFVICIRAQTYPPPVSQPGTTAMYKDSSAFVNWATGCEIVRGYQDISNPGSGFASSGDNTMATGKAESNAAVSLGDGGWAICTFGKPILNGPGYDFAVFENGFDDVFLELAFVEVSSDGVNFFRFPAHSLTDTTTQTNSFGSTDATKINNLAGKYRGGYGTPFDLQELAGTTGLDVNAVTHVKIIDVIGSMNSLYATRDFYHNKINDPWPTPFPSGGFDLDAIGVIHQSTVTDVNMNESPAAWMIYPNPVKRGGFIHINKVFSESIIELCDVSGKLLLRSKEENINTTSLGPGLYCLRIISESNIRIKKLIIRE